LDHINIRDFIYDINNQKKDKKMEIIDDYEICDSIHNENNEKGKKLYFNFKIQKKTQLIIKIILKNSKIKKLKIMIN
jgi:hypothetical protein